jgi:hypothetical protein
MFLVPVVPHYAQDISSRRKPPARLHVPVSSNIANLHIENGGVKSVSHLRRQVVYVHLLQYFINQACQFAATHDVDEIRTQGMMYFLVNILAALL